MVLVGPASKTVVAAKATVATAKAQIQAAEAAVQTARLNLEFTRLTSPIDGIAGVAQLQVGALVSQGASDVAAYETCPTCHESYHCRLKCTLLPSPIVML